jgi:antimicrobial peptide system SdpA family protein
MQQEGQQHCGEPTVKMSDTRLGIYVLALMLFWTTVVAYSVHPVLPANPIQLPLEENSPLVKLLPQGWGFFTRDPRSPEMFAFVKTSDGLWQPVVSGKPFWPRLLEFSRRRKLAHVEIGVILYELSDPQWQACQDLPAICLENAPLSGTVKNILSPPSLCGEVGIIQQTPIPWAWSQSPEETLMPSEVLRLQVSCHG